MGEKIAIVTDSVCDLSQRFCTDENVHVIPLRIVLGDREYEDNGSFDLDSFFADAEPIIPQTATPLLGDIEALWNKLHEEQYTHILGVTLSSGLSSTYNNFCLAAEQMKSKIHSFIIDSKLLSWAQGALVEKAVQLRKKQVSFEALCETVMQLRPQLKVYFSLQSLKFLMQGGRVGKVTGSIGEILRIRPLISMDDEGKFFTFERVRGNMKAFGRLVHIARALLNENAGRFVIVHGAAQQAAEMMAQQLETLPNVRGVHIAQIGAIIGIHTGPGLIGFTFIPE